MRVNERVPCPGTIEALYYSVFDFEYYRTLNTLESCVSFLFFYFISSVITNFRLLYGLLSVITGTIRIYNGYKKLTGCRR